MLAGAAAMSASKLSWAQNNDDDFYDNALVIDALCFLREWDEAELGALRKTGYAGIMESLSNRSLQIAIDALVTAGRDPGPLAGVPIALKDIIDQTGLPNTTGASFPAPLSEKSATVRPALRTVAMAVRSVSRAGRR